MGIRTLAPALHRMLLRKCLDPTSTGNSQNFSQNKQHSNAQLKKKSPKNDPHAYNRITCTVNPPMSSTLICHFRDDTVASTGLVVDSWGASAVQRCRRKCTVQSHQHSDHIMIRDLYHSISMSSSISPKNNKKQRCKKKPCNVLFSLCCSSNHCLNFLLPGASWIQQPHWRKIKTSGFWLRVGQLEKGWEEKRRCSTPSFSACFNSWLLWQRSHTARLTPCAKMRHPTLQQVLRWALRHPFQTQRPPAHAANFSGLKFDLRIWNPIWESIKNPSVFEPMQAEWRRKEHDECPEQCHPKPPSAALGAAPLAAQLVSCAKSATGSGDGSFS